MAKFLGTTGLQRLVQWIKNYAKITVSNNVSTIVIGDNSITPLTEHQDISGKVDKTTTVNGHALSGNVTVTASDIGVAAGAEVNQNAFSNVKVGSTTIEADTKTDTLELAAASNSVLSITPTAASDKVEFDVDKDLSKYDNSTAGFITSADVPEGAAASTTTPKMDGTAAVGTETAFARGDHQHPTDTSRAPLASPAFTGTPTAPTAAAGTNSTQVATTAFVKAAVDAAKVGAATFQGTAPTTFAPTNYKKGYYWVVATAGTYVGETCEPGDMIFCVSDYSSAYSASDFSVVQNNVIEMTTADVDAAIAAADE